MKIVCLSDLHGYLPINLPEGDILVIAGDICPADDHTINHQLWWLKNKFSLWLNSLQYKEIVAVCGNHDWVFMNAADAIPKMKWHYLEDSSVTIDDIKFYGYPHTPKFLNWAFMRSPEFLEIVANNIPSDTDVLLTHGPAYGILDTITDIFWQDDKRTHLGCKSLKKRLDNMPDLKLHVCGHIHSGHGIITPCIKDKLKTTYVNASYVNERYQHDYNIIVVTI